MNRYAAFLLALVISIFVASGSTDYFFRHPMYEIGDTAANSLSVDRAKHFAQLYGAYSRWGFHHPGPAFFYVQALGEWLFFDVLGIVPAPFNGQALLCLFMEIGFFVAALQVFTRWLPYRARWWFFPLAILLAALHFGNPSAARLAAALPASLVFQSTWTAHAIVLIFLCLIVASASVAAGRAEELPLLVLAGGSLVHAHVALPMFVLPCALLAYAGLVGQHASRQNDTGATPLSLSGRILAGAAAPWRQHRRAHFVSAVLLAVFALPIIVDLARGSQSNFLAILHHLRTHQGERKPFLQSLLYFLQFGAYSATRPGQIAFDHYDAAEMWRYLRANAGFYLAWAVAFGLAAWAAGRSLWAAARGQRMDDADRFLGWAGVYLFLAVVLTLIWGVIQDGEMFYYNAWFNFAIYFFAALIAAGFVAYRVLDYLKRRGGRGNGLRERGGTVLAAVLGIAVFAVQIKIKDGTWSARLDMHERLKAVMATTAASGSVKFLNFQEQTWPYAAGVALQLERAGEKFVVPARWATTFGAEHTQKGTFDGLARTDLQRWSVIEPGNNDRLKNAGAESLPLMDGFGLAIGSRAAVDLNRSGTTIIDFRAKDGPATIDFELAGWTAPEAWGEWIDGKRAVLAFRAEPVSGDVKLGMDVFPFFVPAHGLRAQRLRVSFNGEQVGPELRLDQPDQPLSILTIPQEVWNRVKTHAVPNAVLELELPDAVSSQALDGSRSGDPRALALGVRRILLTRSDSGEKPDTAVSPGHGPDAGATVDAESLLSGEYVFDGKPVPPAKVTGISADGWAGRQATVLLPRAPGSQAPFLMLSGTAVERPGLIAYPYRFTTRVGNGAATESIIEAPGEFEVLVPLPAGEAAARNSEIHFAFPQTFVPARTDPGSRDDRELSLRFHALRITTDSLPLFVCTRQGWYGRETDPQHSWQWGQTGSVMEVAAARSGMLVISGDLGSQAAGNEIDLLLDGNRFATQPIKEIAWTAFEARVSINAGKHILVFRSHLPGVQPLGDSRVIALGLRNAQLKLD